MQHVDEGTIHAWLDGALDAAEASRVEQHVAQCKECAALVAEARGFIAGASRIVSALDVPGGVTPRRGVASVPSRSTWRLLRLSPFRAGLAATLMVAVASLLVVRADRSARSREAPPLPSVVNAGVRPTDSTVSDAAPNREAGVSAKSEVAPPPRAATAPMRDATAPKREVAAPQADAADTRMKKPESSGVPADSSRPAATAASRPPAADLAVVVASVPVRDSATDSTSRTAAERTSRLTPVSVASPRARVAAGFAPGMLVEGCYLVADTTAWPRSLRHFALSVDSATRRRVIRTLESAPGDTQSLGNWFPNEHGAMLFFRTGVVYSLTVDGISSASEPTRTMHLRRTALGDSAILARVDRVTCPR